MGKFSRCADDQLMIGDNLHKMSNPVFWEKIRKYFKMSSAEIFTERAKHVALFINCFLT